MADFTAIFDDSTKNASPHLASWEPVVRQAIETAFQVQSSSDGLPRPANAGRLKVTHQIARLAEIERSKITPMIFARLLPVRPAVLICSFISFLLIETERPTLAEPQPFELACLA